MVVKGPVQRGMPGQDAEQKKFLAQRLSVNSISPIFHLHGRPFVTALLNLDSGLPPYPSLKALRQNAGAASIPVAPDVSPTSAQQGFQFVDPTSKFVFGSASTTTSSHGRVEAKGQPGGTTEGKKKKRLRKRKHHGAAVAGTVYSSPDEASPTPATSLPVATLAQVPSSGTSFFPSPLFNVGRPGSHQQMDMKWRLQVRESITTLQRGQVHLEQSVTCLQVESSVSTYMMSLHLINQGWTEAQIEEKLQAERQKQLELLKQKKESAHATPGCASIWPLFTATPPRWADSGIPGEV